MGLRFHRSIRLLPGLRVNLSKSGVGLSAGDLGVTYSIGPKSERTTIGVPGTGVSYLKWRSRRRMAGRGSGIGALVTLAWAVFAVLVLFLFLVFAP